MVVDQDYGGSKGWRSFVLGMQSKKAVDGGLGFIFIIGFLQGEYIACLVPLAV